MRTSIDIDDDLLDEARQAAGTSNKKDTVDFALRELVRRRARRRTLDLRGTVEWSGDLDVSRASR